MAHPTLIFAADAEELLADRVRHLRLAHGWTRETLAERAGVTAASLKRFERTGKASLELLLKVAAALGRLQDFSDLLQPPEFETLAELEKQTKAQPRKRGSR